MCAYVGRFDRFNPFDRYMCVYVGRFHGFNPLKHAAHVGLCHFNERKRAFTRSRPVCVRVYRPFSRILTRRRPVRAYAFVVFDEFNAVLSGMCVRFIGSCVFDSVVDTARDGL